MCNYYELVKENIAKYRGDEKVMWESVGAISALLERLREAHPDIYWAFMREQHELMVGRHFNEAYALWEVEQMCHKGEDGVEHKGEHWSVDETSSVLTKYRSKIPNECNEWDFYVALNATFHDYCRVVMKYAPERFDEVVIELAVAFWFLDEDWPNHTKVWDYFNDK